MFGALLRGTVGVAKLLGRNTVAGTRAVSNIPLVKTVAKQTAIGAGIYAAGNLLTGGGGGGSLPALPGGGGLPALPGGGGIVGDRGLFQNDPNIAAALQPWAISKTNLRVAYRSPLKGFVVVRDANGDPYALPKTLARKYAGWKPSAKPPISAGAWAGLKRADRTAKQIRKILGTAARVDKNVGKGGKVKYAKKGGR